ncbi:MAG: VOC family protein [Lautropia sp.]|nr:VOC family protein [Lautropia sp.]
MFSHLLLGTNDIERAQAFYDGLMGVLGVPPGMPGQTPQGQRRVFYRHEGQLFGVTEPINGEPATVANGMTVGFRCASPEQVQQFHDTAVALGGVSVEDPPGLRQTAAGELFLAYVRDPDGNKLCALSRPE